MSDQVTRRLLLVEDDPPLSRVYCEYLRDEPVEIVSVGPDREQTVFVK